MRTNRGKGKKTKAKTKKAVARDLKPTGADATKGGSTSASRLDPYKNFKFRP
jgi:hypothetical protein